MKRAIAFILVLLFVLCGCGNPYDSDILNKYTKLDSGLLYTNLANDEVQEEVREALLGAGADETAVDEILGLIEHYNDLAKESPMLLLSDFTQTDTNFVDFSVYYYPAEEKWFEYEIPYYDINCHITAFHLFRQYVSAKNPLPVVMEYVYDDNNELDVGGDFGRYFFIIEFENIQKHPVIDWTQDEMDLFYTIYKPTLSDSSTEEEAYKALTTMWKERGISFKKGNLSLITVWHWNGTDLGVLHSAVLAEYNGGLLLFEKVNPWSHYQASIFNNTAEVKKYMLDQMDSYGHDTIIVMRNDKLME